jgi:hypothetical protein
MEGGRLWSICGALEEGVQVEMVDEMRLYKMPDLRFFWK